MAKTHSKQSNVCANIKNFLTKEEINVLSEDGKSLFNKALQEGIPGNIVARMVNRAIEEKKSELAAELDEKFKKEIEAENFKEEVIPRGRDKFVYHKFVQVDEYKSVVDQKSFNSERALRQWLKVMKIRGLI